MKGFTITEKLKLISSFRSCNDAQFNEIVAMVLKEKKRRIKKAQKYYKGGTYANVR